MCEKIGYNTYAEAKKVVNNAQKIGRVKHRNLSNKRPKRVYKCPLCGLYHLTSKKRPNKTKYYK